MREDAGRVGERTCPLGNPQHLAAPDEGLGIDSHDSSEFQAR